MFPTCRGGKDGGEGGGDGGGGMGRASVDEGTFVNDTPARMHQILLDRLFLGLSGPFVQRYITAEDVTIRTFFSR